MNLLAQDKIARYLENRLSLGGAVSAAANAGLGKGLVHVAHNGMEWFESYHQLLYRARQILTGLICERLRPADHVLLQLDQSDEFAGVFHASILGGLVPVVLPLGTGDDTAHGDFLSIYEHYPSGVVVCSDAMADELRALCEPTREAARILNYSSLPDHPVTSTCHSADQDEIALILAGYTEKPELKAYSHRDVLSHVHRVARASELLDENVSISSLPLSHTSGIIPLHLAHMLCGMTQVVANTNVYDDQPENFLEKVRKHEANIAACPTSELRDLIQAGREIGIGDWDLSSLRLLYSDLEDDLVRDQFTEFFGDAGLSSDALTSGLQIVAEFFPASPGSWESAMPTMQLPPAEEEIARPEVEKESPAEPVRECEDVPSAVTLEPEPEFTPESTAEPELELDPDPAPDFVTEPIEGPDFIAMPADEYIGTPVPEEEETGVEPEPAPETP
ncbi:MAG: AMP-binding protein, partial [Pseudomonadales bacterium]|nr:AMP-binding protein [Pseudomonadales bacterium]